MLDTIRVNKDRLIQYYDVKTLKIATTMLCIHEYVTLECGYEKIM